MRYYHGRGVAQSYVTSHAWYLRAARQDPARAQLELGYLYRQGRGVPRDPAVAVQWYRKAAEQGEAMAELILGEIYVLGEGAARDESAGVYWYRRAAQQRNVEAQFEEIQQRFGEWVIDAHFPPPGTPTQPIEAGYMANAWVRMRHPDYEELQGMLDVVGRTVQVRAG